MDIQDRLKQARERAGYQSATDAARAFGWNEFTYRAHEAGIRGIKTGVADRYARAFKVKTAWLLTGDQNAGPVTEATQPVLVETPLIPFRGVAAAGVWMEHDDLAQEAPTLPSLPGYPPSIQFAVRVAGPSMDRKGINHGDYLLCVNYFDARGELTSGDVVIVERRRGGTVERTCKELVVLNGRFELWPRSSDPRFQDPIVVPDRRSPIAEDGTEVEVIGLVKASHRMFG